MGSFSIRGGILDIFSPESDFPYRIELFDDEVDSIRKFDIITQRSLDRVDKDKFLQQKKYLYSIEIES